MERCSDPLLPGSPGFGVYVPLSPSVSVNGVSLSRGDVKTGTSKDLDGCSCEVPEDACARFETRETYRRQHLLRYAVHETVIRQSSLSDVTR